MRSLLFPWSSIYGLIWKIPPVCNQYPATGTIPPSPAPTPPASPGLQHLVLDCTLAAPLHWCPHCASPFPPEWPPLPLPNTFLTQPGSATPHQAAQTPDASLPWPPLHCFSPALGLTQHTGWPLPPVPLLRYPPCPTQTPPSNRIRLHLPSPSPRQHLSPVGLCCFPQATQPPPARSPRCLAPPRSPTFKTCSLNDS